MLDVILFLVGLFGLIIASVTDLQRREVPDFLNYGLIAAAIGIRLLYAILMHDWWQLLFSVIGAFVFFGVACLFFYTGQWGGGDAKMLIALGALFATFTPAFGAGAHILPAFVFAILPSSVIEFVINYNLLFMFFLIVNILIAGAVYGICWSIVLAIIHRSVWWRTVKLLIHTKKMKILGATTLVCVIGLFILATTMMQAILRFMLMGLAVIAIIGFCLQLAMAAVERACMIRPMRVCDLTEGEWIQKRVTVNGKYICGPKDLGVSEEQIKRLKKLGVKSVIVKIGIPFIPAFLIGFLITVIVGNLFAALLV